MTVPDCYDDDSENKCPICHGSNFNVHNIAQDDPDSIYKEFSCNYCNAEGRETYGLDYLKTEV